MNLPHESQRTKAGKKPWQFMPMFDLFGISPSFYLDGADKTVSWIGFISSLLLASIIAAVAIFYTVDYFKNGDPTVYLNTKILTGAPIVNFEKKNFFLVIKHNYPEGKPLSNFREKIISTRLFYSLGDPASGQYLYSRQTIPEIPCSELKLDLSDLQYSPEDLDGASCAELNQDHQIGGSYELFEKVSTLQI